MSTPFLIVFAGLPGVGKTTLAGPLARSLGAAYLRIDVIEQALRASGALAGDVGAAGYVVACALAESNLRAGLCVVADCVNPVEASRAGWQDAAEAASARLIDVEVVCSDALEHRRRVESRTADVPGHVLPTWDAVTSRGYEPWERPRLVIDTARKPAADALSVLMRRIAAAQSD